MNFPKLDYNESEKLLDLMANEDFDELKKFFQKQKLGPNLFLETQKNNIYENRDIFNRFRLPDKFYPLEYAIKHNRKKLFKFLLEEGAFVNYDRNRAPSNWSSTLLFSAEIL